MSGIEKKHIAGAAFTGLGVYGLTKKRWILGSLGVLLGIGTMKAKTTWTLTHHGLKTSDCRNFEITDQDAARVILFGKQPPGVTGPPGSAEEIAEGIKLNIASVFGRCEAAEIETLDGRSIDELAVELWGASPMPPTGGEP